jgi:hypothetical protein
MDANTLSRHIPPEAVEAAAKREHEMDFISSGDDPPPWENLTPRIREWRMKRTRAALAAGLAAWPRALTEWTTRGRGKSKELILPLPQEEGE